MPPFAAISRQPVAGHVVTPRVVRAAARHRLGQFSRFLLPLLALDSPARLRRTDEPNRHARTDPTCHRSLTFPPGERCWTYATPTTADSSRSSRRERTTSCTCWPT